MATFRYLQPVHALYGIMEKIIETGMLTTSCAPSWLKDALEIEACDPDWDDTDLNSDSSVTSYPLGFV